MSNVQVNVSFGKQAVEAANKASSADKSSDGAETAEAGFQEALDDALGQITSAFDQLSQKLGSGSEDGGSDATQADFDSMKSKVNDTLDECRDNDKWGKGEDLTKEALETMEQGFKDGTVSKSEMETFAKQVEAAAENGDINGSSNQEGQMLKSLAEDFKASTEAGDEKDAGGDENKATDGRTEAVQQMYEAFMDDGQLSSWELTAMSGAIDAMNPMTNYLSGLFDDSSSKNSTTSLASMFDSDSSKNSSALA